MTSNAAALESAGPVLERMEETGLIQAVQKGDRGAFDLLVRKHDQSVLRLALNLLGSPEDARDAYQEAFLRVYRNIHLFRFDCSFHTWLYRIATNICLDHLRKRKIRREEPAVVETPEGFVDRLEAAGEERPSSDPERTLRNRRLKAKIDEALGGLTPRERMVFELRHHQGMRLRSIGEALGTSEEAAKNCLFRATQKLRGMLGDYL
jgi:RNA polymerase sigma-70 factor (ECF subfamily)